VNTVFHYRVIMVGTDFSPASRNAVRRATDLARRFDAQLHVVHVLEKLKPALPFLRANRETVQELQKDLREKARERLVKLLPRGKDLEVRHRVLQGAADEQLLHYAERINADLLVLSSVGQSHIQEFLIGSTTDRCLRRSHIPVMVVPWHAEDRH